MTAALLIGFSPVLTMLALVVLPWVQRLVRPFLVSYLWLAALLIAGGCTTARADKALLFTENGVRAAEMRWDEHFWERLRACSEQYEPGTPEAQDCFGATAKANKAVDAAVQAIVPALRVYWAARAAGESPDWATTAVEVSRVLGDLPPDVRQYFERIQGIK